MRKYEEVDDDSLNNETYEEKSFENIKFNNRKSCLRFISICLLRSDSSLI